MMKRPSVPATARLERTYDVERLRAEVGLLQKNHRSLPHPGPYHDGEWRGISLYAVGGSGTWSGGRRSFFEPVLPTPALAQAPYIKSILAEFEYKQSARILTLSPRARIRKHVDRACSLHGGLSRLHIPIVTHSDVRFTLAGDRCSWQPGELWYGVFSKPHSVDNRSPITRVHLVVDVLVTESFLKLFPADALREIRRDPGIRSAPPAIRLRPDELKGYECDFMIRRKKASDRRSVSCTMGSVRLKGRRLRFFAESRSLFDLVPMGEDLFFAESLGPAVVFRFLRKKKAIAAIQMARLSTDLHIDLEVVSVSKA